LFGQLSKTTGSALAGGPDPVNDRSPLIVIPCLNEEVFIGPLLRRLLGDPGLHDPLIVVADGGSRDRTRAIVEAAAERDPRVRLLPNPRRLQSAGVNLAVRLFGRDRAWLLRVDAHAGYPEAYASTLIAEALATGANAVAVPMETVGETGFQRACAVAQTTRLGTGGSPHRIQSGARWVDHGHHALFRMEDFVEAGGYDESFSHNEDAELDVRLTNAGAKIWLTDVVKVIYYPRATPAALWRQYLNYGRGRARTVLKHNNKLRARQALPLAVAPAVLVALASPFWWPAGLPALAWALLCLTYGAVLALQRRDGWALLSGPAAMIMHLAWSAGFWSQLLVLRITGGGKGPGEMQTVRP
jgi:succinoglycan biosynthesis protein ExoA